MSGVVASNTILKEMHSGRFSARFTALIFSDVFAVGHGAKDGAMAADFEGAIVPG